jgi:hypothetical protein
MLNMTLRAVDPMETRLHSALDRVVGLMQARREVGLSLARARSVGLGQGTGEQVVRTRVQAGVGRTQQLALLADAHQAAMVRALLQQERLSASVRQLVHDGPHRSRGREVLELCYQEQARFAEQVERYPRDRAVLDRLIRRWWTLSPARRAA